MQPDQLKGFTLLELLMVIALLAIIATLAPPALSGLLQRNRDDALRGLLTDHLQQARLQAVLTGKRHTLCGSQDGNRCDGGWSGHWLLRAEDDERILQREKLPEASQLCWQGFSDSVRFLPNGTSPSSNGRFALCRSGETVWELVINRQGRVRQASASEYGDCCATSHTGQ